MNVDYVRFLCVRYAFQRITEVQTKSNKKLMMTDETIQRQENILSVLQKVSLIKKKKS